MSQSSTPPHAPGDPAGPDPTDSPPADGAPPARSPGRLMGPFGVAATLFFLVIWLAPITYVGSAGRDIRWMHRDLRHMHRVACLFTKEVGAWGTYHIQVRQTPGGPWVELPLEGYFDMSIFGYRTRFHRMIGKSYRRSGGRARSRHLALWIAERYAELNPGEPPLQGVRYVSASRTIASLLKEEGRFRKLPLAEVPRRRHRVLMTFDGAEMRYVPKRRRSKRSKRSPRSPKRALQALPRDPRPSTPPATPPLIPPAAPAEGPGAAPAPKPRLQPLPAPGAQGEAPSGKPLRAIPVPGGER